MSTSQYFSSDYMQSQMNVELGTASRLYSISGLAAAISGPLLGLVYDKFGMLPLFLLISSVVLIPTSVLYLFFVQLGLAKPSANMGVLVSSIVLMAISEASQATIKQVILVRALPTSHYSILQGLTLSVTNAFAGISLYIVGLISKTDPSYTSASVLTQCFVVMLLVLSVMIYIFDMQSGGSLTVPSSMEVVNDDDTAPKDPMIADEDDESEVARLVHQAVPQRSDSRVVSVHYDDVRTATSSRANSRTLTK
jgi:MFS family permease